MSYLTTYANLKQYAQDRYHDGTDTKAVREIGRFVNDAFRRLAREHDWSFYLKTGRVNTQVKYDTGTVAMANGASVITLTGGTFPTDSATGYAAITLDSDTSVEFNVKTRDSGTQVTVDDGQKWLGTSVSGGSYDLYYYTYDLPTNFRKMYDHESQDFFSSYLTPTDWEVYHLTHEATGADPVFYTIVGSKQLKLWPYPTRSYAMDFLYYRWPTALSSDGDTMDWVEDWIDLAHRAIDLEIAVREKKALAECSQIYSETLMKTKAMDSGRQFERRQHRLTQGGIGGGISDQLIRRGGIS